MTIITDVVVRGVDTTLLSTQNRCEGVTGICRTCVAIITQGVQWFVGTAFRGMTTVFGAVVVVIAKSCVCREEAITRGVETTVGSAIEPIVTIEEDRVIDTTDQQTTAIS